MGDEEVQQQIIVHMDAPRVEPPGEIVLNCEREQNFRRFKSRWQSFYILYRLSEESIEYQRALLLYAIGDDAC